MIYYFFYKIKMENYVKDILFKERVRHLDHLNIETLVIFNKEIADKIEELEKDKKDISSNFDSKADLYSLNNTILEII